MMRTTDRRNNRRKTSGRGPRALARWLLTLVVGLGSSGLGETLWAQDRGLRIDGPTTSAPAATSAPVPVEIEGNYKALLIGINEYTKAKPLKAAVKDVKAVEKVLKERYGFRDDNIKLLLDEEATRKNIIDALQEIRDDTEKKDSVFIYYAGHGTQDVKGSWWVPVDGEQDSLGSSIKDTVILEFIRDAEAQHVYLVVDSCFSGSMFTEPERSGDHKLSFYKKAYKMRSRQGLTSGANEPVADEGVGGHSPFAHFLLETLRNNKERYLSPIDIDGEVAKSVAAYRKQTPLSGPLPHSRHEGGQFVFRLTNVTVSSTPVTTSTTQAVTPVTNPAPGPSKKKPESKWEKMLKLLDSLLKDKEKTS